MQTIFKPAKHFTAAYCFVFLSIVVLFNSCKKNDTLISEDASNKIVNTKKFFALPANVSSAVAKVANALAIQNEKTGFITQLANTAGYPVWGKSTVKLIKGSTTTTSNSLLEDYEGGDTCILIPMVLEDGVYVNAFISATIVNDSVTMRLYYKNDYKVYPFKATQPTTSVTTAEEFASQMMLFDEAVFGYTAFQVKDKRLFHSSTNYSDTTGAKVEIEINSNPPTGGGNNLIYCTTTEYSVNYCTTPTDPRCSGSSGCDNCVFPTCWTIIFTQENCTGNQMPGGGGWPSAPPPNGPGGGGSGGGNPPGECLVGGLIENGFAPPNPCYPGGGNPLPPVPPIPPLPNQHLIDSLQGFPCAQNILAHLPYMNNETRTIINDVFNVNDDVNLLFKPELTYTRDSNDAISIRARNANPVNFNETIFLNPWLMNNSAQEYILATMFHETLHASIDYWRMMYVTHEIDSNQFKTMFPIFWNPSQTLPPTTLQHHNEIAENYVNKIKTLIQTFNPNVHDSVATAIAWGGLYHTTAWANRSDTVALRRINLNARNDTTGTISTNVYKLKKCLPF